MCASSHEATRVISLCVHQSSIIIESVGSSSTSSISPRAKVCDMTSWSEGGGSGSSTADLAVDASRLSCKKRQSHAQTSGRESCVSQPSEMIVPMISGCPSAKAAHARPRAVSAATSAAVPLAMKPNCSSQSKATLQSLRNAQTVASRSRSRPSRLLTASATLWRASPCASLRVRISASSFLRALGLRATRAPNSADSPLTLASSSA
mmetsp:Transcript_8085/g.17734  ORF Transcript_8085/g.17734 Transcript_8085/m.17734 type:complete len:207 (-) Transcript_8085:525-1145(-)